MYDVCMFFVLFFPKNVRTTFPLEDDFTDFKVTLYSKYEVGQYHSLSYGVADGQLCQSDKFLSIFSKTRFSLQ